MVYERTRFELSGCTEGYSVDHALVEVGEGGVVRVGGGSVGGGVVVGSLAFPSAYFELGRRERGNYVRREEEGGRLQAAKSRK